jgi:hypothetical protein
MLKAEQETKPYSDGKSREWSGTKIAIASAILTGIFTVLASIATYWLTTKEPELSYSVIGGPTLTVTSDSKSAELKQIFVVEVNNTGKKEVSQTLIQFVMPNGTLSEIGSEASPGVKIQQTKMANQVELVADSLNPGDVVKVSLLVTLNGVSSEPRVAVRAPGVQATKKTTEKADQGNWGKILSIPVGSAALAIALTWAFSLRKSGPLRISSSLDQHEIIAFICEQCGLYEEASKFRFSANEPSYRGSADYLLCQAKRSEPGRKNFYRTALLTMLLVEGINPVSEENIRYAVGEISDEPMTEADFSQVKALAMREEQKPIIWRKRVSVFVESQLSTGEIS